MLRVGQMMLAEVLKRNIFTINGEFLGNLAEDSLYKICEFFADTNSRPTETPFSIHNIATEALKTIKKEPGEWYTSGNIISILSRLIDKYDNNLPEMRLQVALFVEGTIFEDQIIEKATLPPKLVQRNSQRSLSKLQETPKGLNFLPKHNSQPIEEAKDEDEVQESSGSDQNKYELLKFQSI